MELLRPLLFMAAIIIITNLINWPHKISSLTICLIGILIRAWLQSEVCLDMILRPCQPNPPTMYQQPCPHLQVQGTLPFKVYPIICTCCLPPQLLIRRKNIFFTFKMHINVVYGPYCAKPLSPSIMMIYDQHRFQNLNDLVKILKKS